MCRRREPLRSAGFQHGVFVCPRVQVVLETGVPLLRKQCGRGLQNHFAQYSFSIRMNSRMSTELSCQVRALMRLPSMTKGWFT